MKKQTKQNKNKDKDKYLIDTKIPIDIFSVNNKEIILKDPIWINATYDSKGDWHFNNQEFGIDVHGNNYDKTKKFLELNVLDIWQRHVNKRNDMLTKEELKIKNKLLSMVKK